MTVRRNSQVYSGVTIDGEGRPRYGIKTPVTGGQGAWGHEKIIINGITDVTTPRGVQSTVIGWSHTDPLGYDTFTFELGGITSFENPRSTLGIVEGNSADVFLILPDGTQRTQPIFEGFVFKLRPTTNLRWEVTCWGFLRQADLQIHKPRWYFPGHDVIDIGTRAPSCFNDVTGRDYPAIPLVTTGTTTRKKGSPTQYRSEFAAELLKDLGSQWTILPASPGRHASMVAADMTTVSYTFALGQDGFEVDLDTDPKARPKAIYGEYTNPDGGRSQNIHYPFYNSGGDLEGALILPYVDDLDTQPTQYGPDGEVIGPNGTYDDTKLRVEEWVQFGEGLTRSDVNASALQIQTNNSTGYGFVGTVTARTDPQECHRYDIVAGKNLHILNLVGAGVTLHIYSVEVDRRSGSVRMMVSDRPSDVFTIADFLAQRRAAETDPAAAFRNRGSRISQDTKAVWDADGKAGQVKPFAVTGGTWTAMAFPGGSYGTIVEVTGLSSPAAEWSLLLFDDEPDTAWLNANIGDPTSTGSGNPFDVHADDLATRGMIQAWGSPEQPGGYNTSYGAGAKFNGYDNSGTAKPNGTLTGKILDDTSVQWAAAKPPALWVAVYTDIDTTLTITFKDAPVEF